MQHPLGEPPFVVIESVVDARFAVFLTASGESVVASVGVPA
jgi:hypothetical protein